MQETVRSEGRMKRRVLVMLVAGALVLSASGSALAAGKLGGASGMDKFQISCREEVPDAESGGETDFLARLGGKIGVQGGGDD